MPDKASPGSDTGLLGSLRRLGTTALAAVESRLGLLGTDLEIEGLRLAKLLVWIAVSLFLVFLGVVLLAMLVVTLAGEEHRVLALALGVALVYLSLPMPAGSTHIPHFASKIPIEAAIKASGWR